MSCGSLKQEKEDKMEGCGISTAAAPELGASFLGGISPIFITALIAIGLAAFILLIYKMSERKKK